METDGSSTGLGGNWAAGMQSACLRGREQGGKSTRGGPGSLATGLNGRLRRSGRPTTREPMVAPVRSGAHGAVGAGDRSRGAVAEVKGTGGRLERGHQLP